MTENGAADADAVVRDRILEAAFTTFMKSGYSGASMLDIATLARVSKRDLYARVGNKQAMLVACITERAQRFQAPADLPTPEDREGLARLLSSFGTQLLREVSDPTVISVFRLAIAEAVRAPEVARVLDACGREATRAATRKMMMNALAAGLIQGRAEELAEEFYALLWGDLMIGLLLRVVERPRSRELAARARGAVERFLARHAPREAIIPS